MMDLHPAVSNPSYPEKDAMRNLAMMKHMQPIVININLADIVPKKEPRRMSLLEYKDGD